MDARESFLTAWGCAEQSSAGSRGVVQGHVRRVVDGHPPGPRDGFGSGLLAVRGHLRLATVNLNVDVTQEHESGNDNNPQERTLSGCQHAAPVSCVALAQTNKQKGYLRINKLALLHKCKCRKR